MNNSKFFYLFFIIAIVALSGCKNEGKQDTQSGKDNAKSEDVGNVIPPKPKGRTSEDVPFLECLVDGKVFESTGSRGSYIIDETSGKVLIDMSGVSGVVPGNDYITMIGIVLEDFKEEGPYKGYKSFYLKRIVQGATEMQEWESTEGGVNITKWDKESNALSGTFSTVVENKKGQKIKIEAGKFKNVPLEILKVK